MKVGPRVVATCAAIAAAVGSTVGVTPRPAGAAACTATWLGGAGSWDTPGMWSPASVPDGSDDVCITTDQLTTVTLSHSAEIRSLVLGGTGPTQDLRLAHTAGVNTVLTVTASARTTISGQLILTSGDGSTATTRLDLLGAGLTNLGNVFVDRFANGSFEVAGSVLNWGYFYVDQPLVYASGTFTNRGNINVQYLTVSAGRFAMTGGVFDQRDGSTNGLPLTLRGGTLTFSGPGRSAFVVEGDVHLSGNPMAAQRVTVRAPAVGDASITLDGDVTVGGSLVVDSVATGTGKASIHMNGHTLTNSGSLQVIGPGGIREFDGDLVNTGVIDVAHPLTIVNGGSLTNRGRVNTSVDVTLTGGGSYVQEVGGSLEVAIASYTSMGRIQGAGPIELTGELLTVTTFSPDPGDVFNIVSACCRSGVTGTFTTVAFNGRAYDVVYGATEVDLVAHAPAGGTGEFSNPNRITMAVTSPDVSRAGPGSPFPSAIEVDGFEGTIVDVDVTICGFGATYPSDADFLLVSPRGSQALVLSDVGGNGNDSPSDPGSDDPVDDLTLTLDDQALTTPNGNPTLVSGTFKPFDDDNEHDDWGIQATPNTDYFPPPAPPLGTDVALSTFNGEVPNGVWSLYLVDDYPSTSSDGELEYPNLSCGWSIDIVTGVGTTPATDIAVFRPGTSTWHVSGGATTAWGTDGDIPVPGDYDGDGDTDVAVYRPGTGIWYVSGGATTAWGTAGDVPVPGDYDGDGDTDVAVYRPGTGTWFVSGGATVNWGTNGGIPVPGDYDGDGDTDVAVYLPGSGTWYVSGGATTAWGTTGDVPVPGDYDGDGDADVAVFRPGTGTWFVSGGATVNWGDNGDIPVPGDYDGDGDTDVAVYRPATSTWFVQGGATVNWGTDGDIPLSLPAAIREAFFP